jgi:rod shape-determining protein MreD
MTASSGAEHRVLKTQPEAPRVGDSARRRFRGPRPGRFMGRNGLELFGLVIVVLVQATLLSRMRVLGASPNLLLVTTIAWGLLQSVSEGVVWAFAGGLGLDLITGMPLGTSSLAAMTACLLTGIGRNRVFGNNLWWPIVLVAMATPVYGWIVLLTEQLRGVPVDWLGSTVHVVGPELALNVATMVVVYPLLRAMLGKGGR